FVDVKETDFFYKAVLWAVENEITNGLTTTTFGPYAECNRAQVVTFLWRAMEKPEPTAAEHPFTDVAEDQFYFVPMLWAVENGITNGLTETTFGPNATCNRAQVVTFLYRTYVK
ncbi:MAG: S-layer homology domain-containing protein, partial [Ruminococcaceae bacterium]|nr:S-layer homology domain-containing protein [Oscillospiraceae bacterium]